MLLDASDSDSARSLKIYESTKAILFLGTPHQGSQLASIGDIIRQIASVAGFDTSKQNLRTLEIDDGSLNHCHTRFVKLIRKNSTGIEIIVFQEAKGMTGTSFFGLNKKVITCTYRFQTLELTVISFRLSKISHPGIQV